MPQNKMIAYLLILALLSVFVSAQAAENASMPANNTTTANINQTQTQEYPKMVEKAIETVFLIGIILSPLSFIIAVVALWVAWKNRRKTYEIKK